MDNSSILSHIKEILDLKAQYKNLSEISANEDGSVWIEASGEDKKTDLTLSEEKRMTIIRLLAGYYHILINDQNPAMCVRLPISGGGRFQCIIPPNVSSPIFSIRMPATRIIPLDEFIANKTIDVKKYEQLKEAVESRKNIVIAGGTGSGKTTLANSLIDLARNDRLVVLEDTPELIINAKNKVQIFTTDSFSLHKSVVTTLRLKPDRIIVGEIREGATTFELLKAANSGHPGCITTIHASSAKEVTLRINSLLQEVNLPQNLIKDLIKSVVNTIVFIKKVYLDPHAPNRFVRRVEDII